MRELWLQAFTKWSVPAGAFTHSHCSHNIPELKKRGRTSVRGERGCGVQWLPHGKARPTNHRLLFILHIMIGNHHIFGNRYPLYIFTKNPFNGGMWRKFIFLIGDAFM